MLDQSQPRVRSDGERDRPAGIWCSMSCLPINGRNRHRPRAVPFIMPAIRNTRMHSQRVDQIGESGVIAILRGVDPESAIDVATAVIDGGVTALEVTADTPNVAETIGPLRSVRRRARRRWDGSRRRDRPSGTARGRRVPRYADGRRRRHRDRKSLRNAGCDRRIHSDRGHSRLRGRRRLREGVPGRDWRTGTRRPRWPAPADPAGADRRSRPSNAGAYIEAGAAAVGVGSAIVTDDAVANEEYEVIAENARRTVDAVAAARDR